MLYNFLDNSEKRSISGCNYNQHIHSAHADRIMKEHDLIFIREGNWQISQDGEDYNLTEGDVILLQAGHHHYGLIPCENFVKTCYIHFNAHCGDCVKEKMQAGDAWVFPMVVHCKNNPLVEQYFHRIIDAYWAGDAYREKKASAFLDLLLCELAGGKEPCWDIIEEIKRHIIANPQRFFTGEEIAEKYHYSIRTISSKFKRSTGCTLHAWQLKTKCQMAEELMRYNPSLMLKEVAATFGFYDEYHFGRSFKKVMGRSPKRSK